ncbi:tetratricopeptide repeat protein [Cellulomonas sp. P4]|uniref:tetratricopeptide repeat protein n=1 Tax=Cellulomonas sp. P4 TaxID=3142533 RepID=UPI0031BB8328
MGDITLPVISGLVGILLGVATFVAAQSRTRRETLDKRVQREVEAQLGRKYLDFLTAGQDVNAALREASEGVQAEAARIMTEARAHLDQLQSANEIRDALESSLERAQSILPSLGAINSATPSSLVAMLRHNSSPVEVVALVEKIRDMNGARSSHLELAGDAARTVLGDYALARDLYTLAVQRDPQNHSASSELHGLDLESSDPDVREAAQSRLLEVGRHARAGANALKVLFNYYIASGQFERMARDCESLIATDPRRATLYRNLAIARSESGEPEEVVIESFEKALELADATDNITDYINTAKTYAPWLCRKGRFDRAGQVLERAVLLAPDTAEVYSALTTFGIFSENLDLAARAATLARANAEPSAQELMDSRALAVRSLTFLKGQGADEPEPLNR